MWRNLISIIYSFENAGKMRIDEAETVMKQNQLIIDFKQLHFHTFVKKISIQSDNSQQLRLLLWYSIYCSFGLSNFLYRHARLGQLWFVSQKKFNYTTTIRTLNDMHLDSNGESTTSFYFENREIAKSKTKLMITPPIMVRLKWFCSKK